jgi:hypothetical protein
MKTSYQQPIVTDHDAGREIALADYNRHGKCREPGAADDTTWAAGYREMAAEIKALNAVLEPIARQHLGFVTLTTRNSDADDFRDVAVWSVRDALAAAYAAGQKAASRP